MRLAFLLLLLSAPLLACPFCNPGESDLFTDVSGAQAVVLVDKVNARKYKILESWHGAAKPGRIVVAAEPQGKLGKKGRYLLTTAGPPNLPYWSDAPRVLTAEELEFAREALQLRQAPRRQQWDFAADHLQAPSSEISAAAYNVLAAAPLKEVQKRATRVGQKRLEGWALSSKLPAERRALYLLMAYRGMPKSLAPRLSRELFAEKLSPSSPLLGPLAVAYCHLRGATAVSQIRKHFYRQDFPAGRVTPVNRALTLIAEQSADPALKKAVRQLFGEELSHPQRGAFVLAPLAIWSDYSAADKAEELMRRNESITWIKVAVIRYFRSFTSPESKAALQRLSKLDPTLVQRTKDGYRRSDLGID